MAEPGWVALSKLGWERGARFFPNWIFKKLYPQNKLNEWILLFTTGGKNGGPQFYVKPGSRLGVETNEVMVVNFLPLPVDLENVQLEVLLGGTSLASKDLTISRRIGSMSAQCINLRFDLTDNQAAMARDYGGDLLLLQMGVTANFRTHHGLVPLGYTLQIRTVLYK